MRASLFLIPVTLGDTEHRRVLPEYNRDVILSIRHFIVENVRTARRFLKKVEPGIVIDDLTFYELNKHTSPEQVAGYLAPLAMFRIAQGNWYKEKRCSHTVCFPRK